METLKYLKKGLCMKNIGKILVFCVVCEIEFVEMLAVVSPVMPVTPQIITPVQPVMTPQVITPVQQPAVKPVVQLPLSPQPIGTILVANKSKFAITLTGWKTKYKTPEGVVHYKTHTLQAGHTLKPKQDGITTKVLNVSANVPNNSFVEGISHLLIQGAAPVSVEYKNSAWMPGITDKIYVTSANGTDWTLDTTAMDKSYKKINAGSLNASAVVKGIDDSTAKITDSTKAATVPVVNRGKDKKEFERLAQKMKKTKNKKAAQVSQQALSALPKA